MSNARMSHRINASPDVRCRVQTDVCNACQGLCWTLEVWLHDLGGSGQKACVLYREHLASQSMAMTALGRWIISRAAGVRELEVQEYLLEHQERLF